MMGLVGPARGLGGDAPKTLARAFARLAWPAYAVLVVTGFWNVSTVHCSSQRHGLEGGAHGQDRRGGPGRASASSCTSGRRPRASWRCGGRWAGIASVAALVMGILLAG